MHVTIDTNSINYIQIDGKPCSFDTLDDKFMDIIMKKKIDINEYSISNKYLRGIFRNKKGYEYHILEKTCGVTTIYCMGRNGLRKEVHINLPYTIMIIKLKYMNGSYKNVGDRLYHSNCPVNKNFSNGLWTWSLSNVYPTGNICWGSEKLPQVDAQSSYKLIDEFFLATKNSDLLNNKNISWSNMNSNDVYNIDIKHLQKQPFTLMEAINSF